MNENDRAICCVHFIICVGDGFLQFCMELWRVIGIVVVFVYPSIRLPTYLCDDRFLLTFPRITP